MKPGSPRTTPVGALEVYVASPLGFTEPGRAYNSGVVLPSLLEAGFIVHDPWEKEAINLDGVAIGAANARAIERAAAILCVLEGQELDGGTCAEVGYGAALGKFIVGLRSDLRLIGEGLGIVNLQVEYFVTATGGRIVPDLRAAIELLQGFSASRDQA